MKTNFFKTNQFILIVYILMYLSLILGFIYNEDMAGGGALDRSFQKNVTTFGFVNGIKGFLFNFHPTNTIIHSPIYYILILEINFFSRSAAIGINLSDKQIFFNNIFNDISLTFTYLMFYLLPFLITKIIKIKDIFSKKNLFLTILIFIPCVIYFDYNVSFSGGGIFFKASNYFFNNNFIFFIICFFSMLAILPVILSNYMNLILFLLIILNNPQYTIYHKYFDPFLIISYFLIFHLNIDLKKILILRNYSFVFFYFFLFLLISNFKYLWII